MDLNAYENDSIQILELSGRFDAYSSPAAREWIETATELEPANIVVNLAGVQFVDSTALATLVQGMKRCRQLKGDLRLCGLQQPVRMIFELTRLDKAFEIFSGEEEAIQAFASA